MKYRPEIDGLRALAVVPVILFHAGFEVFSGGFVGVDVFFVISGYLITSILIEEIDARRFSVFKFYERRMRRILPALLFVMLVCIPLSWIWMLPSQMKDFSQSLFAVIFFVSNIFFWKQSGYFEAVSEENPLLHTWSLAVEEQYYLFFPMYLALAWRFGRSKVFWTIVVMASASFLLSEWGWRNKPNANFYLTPTRVWELFAGAIAAFEVQRNGVKSSSIMALLGVAAISFSIFAYDEITPFPSIYTLIPVLGAVLIVLYADKDTVVARILSCKVFVGVGLISYSAYLWHQPVYAFARLRVLDAPSIIMVLMLTVVIFILAFLSWRYIETPFRKRKAISRLSVFSLSAVGLLILLLFGGAGYVSNGQIVAASRPPNISYESLRERISSKGLPCEWSPGFAETSAFDGCAFGDLTSRNNVVLIGDSHSQALSYVVEKWGQQSGRRIVWLKMNGCEYIPNLVKNRQVPNVDCERNHRDMIQYIGSLNADVILIFRWTFRMYPVDEFEIAMPYTDSSGNVENESYREYFVYKNGEFHSSKREKYLLLNKYIKSISDVANRLFLVHPVPETAIDISKRNYKYWNVNNQILDEIYTESIDYDERNYFIEGVFDKISVENVIHVRPRELFCDSGRCFMQKGGVPLYLDDDHLGDPGSLLILEKIVESYN